MPANTDSIRRLWQLWAEVRYRDALPLLAPEFRAVWPMSREILPTPEAFIRVQEEYPGAGTFEVEDIFEDGDTVISIVNLLWDGNKVTAISRWRFNRAGLITEVTEWWPEPTEPLPGREHLTLRF